MTFHPSSWMFPDTHPEAISFIVQVLFFRYYVAGRKGLQNILFNFQSFPFAVVGWTTTSVYSLEKWLLPGWEPSWSVNGNTGTNVFIERADFDEDLFQ